MEGMEMQRLNGSESVPVGHSDGQKGGGGGGRTGAPFKKYEKLLIFGQNMSKIEKKTKIFVNFLLFFSIFLIFYIARSAKKF